MKFCDSHPADGFRPSNSRNRPPAPIPRFLQGPCSLYGSSDRPRRNPVHLMSKSGSVLYVAPRGPRPVLYVGNESVGRFPSSTRHREDYGGTRIARASRARVARSVPLRRRSGPCDVWWTIIERNLRSAGAMWYTSCVERRDCRSSNHRCNTHARSAWHRIRRFGVYSDARSRPQRCTEIPRPSPASRRTEGERSIALDERSTMACDLHRGQETTRNDVPGRR